jgi:hypothetical protein
MFLEYLVGGCKVAFVIGAVLVLACLAFMLL